MKTTDIKFFRSPSLGHLIKPYSRFPLQSFGQKKCPKGFHGPDSYRGSGLNSIVIETNELRKKSAISLKFSLLFFFISTFIFAQQVNFDSGKVQQKKYLEEITFEEINNKIIIPVQINGKSYRFLLDIGAPNLISKELYESLNTTKSDSIPVNDASNLNQNMVATTISQIQIGNLIFENQVALVFDIKQHKLLECHQIDGFIGSNLFKNSILKISRSQGKITITDQIKLLKPKTKPSKLKLVGFQKAPYVQFYLFGSKNAIDYVLIDTGMDGYYDMANRNFDIFQKTNIFEVIASSKGIGGIGLFGASEPSEQKLINVKNGSIGRKKFQNIFIKTTDDNNSRIGLDFFNHGEVIIDFKNKKVYFEGKTNIQMNEVVPKFQPTVVNEKFVIGLVWDPELAQKIYFGDEIISIDGIKIEDIEFCNIFSFRKQLQDKKQYVIEIKTSGNQIINIEIDNP